MIRPDEIYLSGAQIAVRVAELGAEISRDYVGLDLVLVASLKAAAVLCADLSRAVTISHGLDTVEVTPFRAETRGSSADGSGSPALRKRPDLDLAGRDVLIVEDIVDTGLTLSAVTRHVAGTGPRSLAAVTLLDRPYRRLVPDLPLRYVGFTTRDDLFVGYGLDLEQRFRNLPDIHVLPRV